MGTRPWASTTACVCSIMISKRIEPVDRPELRLERVEHVGERGAVLGDLQLRQRDHEAGGDGPRVASSSVLRNTSSVRTERTRSSSVIGLMRMPQKGGSVPPSCPRAASRAQATACPSSSSSGRAP